MEKINEWNPHASTGRAARLLVHFVQVLDVVLKQKKIRLSVARQPDEVGVVEFDDPFHFLVVAETYAHSNAIVDQTLQEPYFFEGLFGCFCATDFTWHDGSARIIPIIPSPSRSPQVLVLQFDTNTMKSRRILRLIARIVTQQILGAEIAQNIGKRVVELRADAGREDPAASAGSERFKGVLAAYVAPRIVGDGDHHDQKNGGIRELCGTESVRIFLGTGGVAAVADGDDYMTSFAIPQGLTREVNGVVERGAALGLQRPQTLFDAPGATRETAEQRHLIVKRVQRRHVLRISLAKKRP